MVSISLLVQLPNIVKNRQNDRMKCKNITAVTAFPLLRGRGRSDVTSFSFDAFRVNVKVGISNFESNHKAT